MQSPYEQGGVAGTNPADAARRKALQDALDGPVAPIGATAPIPAPGVVNNSAPNLDAFERRGGGTGGVLGGAAGGASLGSIAGPWGTAAGAIGGAAIGAFTKHADTAPTDFNVNDARTAIGQEYQHDLGRAATPQEIDAQLSGQGWKPGSRYVGAHGLGSVLGSIGKSDEAQQYAAHGSQQPAVTAPTAPAAATGLDFSRLTGYDQGKFDSNKQDAKYQMGRTLAQFDPRAGFTPDVLAALNKLGYGNFTGSGDKLSLAGLTDTGRQNGLTGDYQNADFNVGFKSGNGKWGYADPAAGPAAPQGTQGGPGGPVSLTAPGLSPALGDDPQARIRAELDALINGSQSPALRQALLGRMA